MWHAISHRRRCRQRASFYARRPHGPALAEEPALQVGEARYRLGENSVNRAEPYAALNGYLALKNACFRQVVDLGAGHHVDHAGESPGRPTPYRRPQCVAGGLPAKVSGSQPAKVSGSHITTINEFRRRHRAALAGLFVQVLKLCQRAGLVKLGQVAVDGTKMQANASKHKAMSYVRMQAEEKRLQEEVERLLASADEADAQEDALYGEGRPAFELPEELKRRESRLKKIREAKAALEQEAREQRANELREQAKTREQAVPTQPSVGCAKGQVTKAKRARDQARELDGRDETPAPAQSELPWRTMEVQTDGKPKPTSQRNFTDPESSIMPGRHGFIQAYNCQAAVDGAHQIIIAADVSNQSVDNALLGPMTEQVRDNTGSLPKVVLADSGYWNPHGVEQVGKLGVEVLVAIKRDKHGVALPLTTGMPPEALAPRELMRWRLHTPDGRAHYARRKAVVEPVFGQIRIGQRFQRLSFRGLIANTAEWKLVAACHNLLKLFRLAPMALA